jgi:hypothetical protein
MTCPSCGEIRKPDEFYATSTECRSCKKRRSQQNRADAAQKVALADRLLDVLERLADQGWQPKALLATGTEVAPERATAPRPEPTRQGVNP